MGEADLVSIALSLHPHYACNCGVTVLHFGLLLCVIMSKCHYGLLLCAYWTNKTTITTETKRQIYDKKNSLNLSKNLQKSGSNEEQFETNKVV